MSVNAARTSACATVLLNLAAWCAPNPLAPLTAAEIHTAAVIVKSSGRAPDTALFSLIALQEPPKDAVLKQTAAPRRAFAIVYDYRANQTWETVVNLSTASIDSWKEIPGVEPPITGDDSGLADRIARSDPRFARAMSARGIRDLNNVFGVSWSAGYFQLPGTDRGRIVREVFYYGGAGQNWFAHPIEGVVAHVNITEGKVLDFLDIDRDAPISRENFDLTPGATAPYRTAPAPLHITQPSGVGFEVHDNEVRWQNWQFRFGLQPREGLVLYTVGYEDGGRVRPILYRAAEAVIEEVLQKYPDRVRLQFRSFPLAFHPQAPLAHEAAMLAAKEGHFWEFVSYILAHQDSLREQDLIAYAGQLSMDQRKFAQGLQEHRYAPRVDADVSEGFRRGIRGSPVIFVDKKRIDGVPSLKTLTEYVEAELAAKK